jgi:hypothetical protein
MAAVKPFAFIAVLQLLKNESVALLACFMPVRKK